MQYYIFLAGFIVSVLTATLGAWISRKMKVDYAVLVGLCFINYFMTGFTAAQSLTIYASICFAATLAVVDLTLGADLSKKVGFYTRVKTKQHKGIMHVATHAFIVGVASIVGMYGGLAAGAH